MVLGPDPLEPSWVWCVGQGGYGIQTAAAVGRLTAGLAGADGVGLGWTAGTGIDVGALSPRRLGGAHA